MSNSVVQLMSKVYHEHLLGEMQQLRLMGSLCDVTVQVDFQGELEEFEAHQVMLAASSGYFKELLLGKDPPTKIFLETVPTADFASFLEFVYTAKLEVEKIRTGDILEMAKLLDCRDLIEACTKANKSMAADADGSNTSQLDSMAQVSESSEKLKHNIPPDLQFQLDSFGQEASSSEPTSSEKPSPSKRAEKKKETKTVVQGRRLSNRLAGRKVFVEIPKKKYVRKLKDQRKAPKILGGQDSAEKTHNEKEPQEPLVWTEEVLESMEGTKTEALEDTAETADVEDQEMLEDDPASPELKTHKEEEEEEEEEGKYGEGRGTKRKRNGQFKCEKCLRSFHYEKSYLKHISVSHGVQPEVTYRCGTCSQTFANRCNLKIHERHVHSDERLFPCDVCNKAFKRKKDVKRHCRQVHEGGGERHFCPVCGKSLSSKTALVLHQRTHTGDRPYECTDCGAKFSQSSALKTHRRTHTGEKPFSCDLCGARFTQNHMLSYHKRCHTGEKPYMCENCGKSFASKEYLKHHARIHSGSKPYKCEICERAFAQRNSLHQHMKIHTGERPYSCDDCGKQFTQLNALQRHHRIHTGERPYMCMLCNRTFTDKSTVRRHTMTHDKDTPWKNYLVILEGNVESNQKRMKRGSVGEKKEQEEKPVGAEGPAESPEEQLKGDEPVKLAEEESGTVQVEPVTISADWSAPGHGAIALLSHTALGGFTVIQTELQGTQLQPIVSTDSTGATSTQVISLETPAVAVPVQVPVSVPVSASAPLSVPVSLHVPVSAPFSVPVSISLPVPVSTSLSASSAAPLPVSASDPAPLRVPVSASLSASDAAPLPSPVSASVSVSNPASLGVPVALPISVCSPVPTEVCVSVTSSVLEPVPDPTPCITSDPTPTVDGHLAVSDVTVEAISVETMEVSSENASEAAV